MNFFFEIIPVPQWVITKDVYDAVHKKNPTTAEWELVKKAIRKIARQVINQRKDADDINVEDLEDKITEEIAKGHMPRNSNLPFTDDKAKTLHGYWKKIANNEVGNIHRKKDHKNQRQVGPFIRNEEGEIINEPFIDIDEKADPGSYYRQKAVWNHNIWENQKDLAKDPEGCENIRRKLKKIPGAKVVENEEGVPFLQLTADKASEVLAQHIGDFEYYFGEEYGLILQEEIFALLFTIAH
jgi:hypothetical protein